MFLHFHVYSPPTESFSSLPSSSWGIACRDTWRETRVEISGSPELPLSPPTPGSRVRAPLTQPRCWHRHSWQQSSEPCPSQPILLTPGLCQSCSYGLILGLTPAAGGDTPRSVHSLPQVPKAWQSPGVPQHGNRLSSACCTRGLRGPSFMGRDDLVPSGIRLWGSWEDFQLFLPFPIY